MMQEKHKSPVIRRLKVTAPIETESDLKTIQLARRAVELARALEGMELPSKPKKLVRDILELIEIKMRK